MRLSIKITLVLAFIILMFLHVTEPKKKHIKRQKYYRHGALKVVFGG